MKNELLLKNGIGLDDYIPWLDQNIFQKHKDVILNRSLIPRSQDDEGKKNPLNGR